MTESSIERHMTSQYGLWKEDFSYYMPVKIIFGIGVSRSIGREVKRFGSKKILVITDEGIVKAGIAETIKGYLADVQADVHVYDRVAANPTIQSVEDAYSCMRKFQPDLIVGLGGGSAIDTAKVVSVMDTNPTELAELLKGAPLMNKKRIPLIAVATAAGTASEVTLFAPVMDTKRKVKAGIGHYYLMPDVAICDPLLTVTLPPKLTAEIGIDALSHAMEGFLSRQSWEATETLALRGMHLIFKNLRNAYNNGNDLKAREAMLMGNLLAGMAFPLAGSGMVHGFAEPLSGIYNLAHGLTIAIMFPYVEYFNLPSAITKFCRIAEAAGQKNNDCSARDYAKKAVLSLIELIEDVDIPLSLKEVGVSSNDIPALTKQAFEHPCMGTNCRKMNDSQIKKIYEQAYKGDIKEILDDVR